MNLQQRFDKKWMPVTESGCWLWVGSLTDKGYGRIRTGSKYSLAHRVSWSLANGDIPAGHGYHGTCVLHRCDTPACVNPDHLFLGTQSENARDCSAKGRWGKARTAGDAHPMAKLTQEEASEILTDERTQRAIAKEYGVSQATISNIKRLKAWVSEV